MISPSLLAYGIAVACGLGVTFLILGFFFGSKKYIRERQYDEFIEQIVETELEMQSSDQGLPPEKSWFGHWYRLAASAGQANLDQPKMTGWLAIALGVLGFLIGTFAWPGEVVVGILFAFILIFVFRLVLIGNGNKRLNKIDKQLPALLAGMRSSLSANMTPQQAILTQIGEIQAPLGDELLALKQDLDLNIPLDRALDNLALRVPSPELRFLVASMRIAISQGADLDDLLRTLQDILVARSALKDKLASAIASAQPAIYITIFAIPLALVFSYSTDAANRDFWFSLPGLIAFAAVAALYIGAIVSVNKQTRKVKES